MKRVSWQKNLIFLWFSQLAVMSGFSAMIPFVPLFIKNHYGLTDTSELAFYVSAFNFCGSLAYAVFCPIWGVMADRFGVKPMLLRGTFVTSWLFPLMAYVPSAGWLILLRFFSAACAGTTSASQVMIARNTPDNKQGFAQGVLTTAIWGGAMLGNVVGGFMIHYFSYTYAFWLCGILYVFGGVAILFTHDDFKGQPVKKDIHVVRIKSPIPLIPAFTRTVWTILPLFLLMGTIRTVEVPYVSLKIEAISGASVAAYWTGVVSAFACMAAILSGVVNGYLSDKLSPLKLLVPLMIWSAAALFLQGAAEGLFLFAASRVMLYFAAGGLQPVLQKQLSAVTPKRKRGSVFGFSSAFNSSGGMLAAVIGGSCFSLFGLDAVFYFSAAAFIMCIFIFSQALKKAARYAA